jgi:hypothetical protein
MAADFSCVNDRAVPDLHLIPDGDVRVGLLAGVDNAVILHGRVFTYSDAAGIAADDCPRPYVRALSDFYISDDISRLADEGLRMDFRRFALQNLYHVLLLLKSVALTKAANNSFTFYYIIQVLEKSKI